MLTTEEFIRKAKRIRGDEYDYSKVIYKGCKTKVCIICPEHGEFWQTPDNHLNSNQGCPTCRYIKSAKSNTLNTNIFIERAKKIHGEKYDYSKVNYIDNKTKVCIICHEKDENGKEHGEFWQTPTGHIDKKTKCPRCTKNHRYTTEEFMDKLPEWVKEKYDFSKFKYKRTHDKSVVICKEHGEFLMSPHNILKGIGCPGCSESKLEREIRLFLKKNNIDFLIEYKPTTEFNKQTIDFFLPKLKIGIECQGIQHFIPTDFAGHGKNWANEEYKHIIELDKNKQLLCKKNKIDLIYFTTESNKLYVTAENNTHFNKYKMFTSTDELLNYLS